MPLDAVAIGHLARELDGELRGMRIDRIRQPERDMVLFSLHGNGGSRRLLLCFGASSARVCLTRAEYENPAQPPMFCMLLRKHLTGARITSVTQPDNERMLAFSLDTLGEMGELSQKTLYAELLGRNANLVLADADGRILDAARRVDEQMSPLRQLLPGLIYRMPPKPEPGKFSGLSPLIRRELEFRGLPPVPASLDGMEQRPYMLVENGDPKDFSFMPILQYGPGVESVPYSGWSVLLEAFFSQRDRAEHLKSRAKSMTKLVRNATSRTQRKLALRLEELGATEDRELDRRRGELITANIWRMTPGAEELSTEDFYESDSPMTTIPLDPRKTPQQNAAVYYRRYAKKKAAREHLTALIEENTAELEYLDSVAEELSRVQSQTELAEIRRELEQAGYLKAPRDKGKLRREKPLAPLSYTTASGLEILVGRNNLQNDELTFRIARRTDLWLHAQKLHGAHVILRCGGTEPDEESVYMAACLAAYHSEAASAGRVPVDAAPVRLVKKPRGARPGKVIYTGQRTIIAEAKI